MSEINHPIDLLGKFPVDAKNVTFNTLEQALTTITNFKRYRGLIIKIKNGKWITRYWWESDDLSDSGISLLDKYPEITNEPTGFKSDAEEWNCDIGVEYTTSKTIKLTGAFTGYFKGKDVIRVNTGESWESDPCPNIVGEKHYFLEYNGTAFVWKTDGFDFRHLMIAYCYFRSNGDFVFALREPHGTLQWQSHARFHNLLGTVLESGGDFTDYVKGSNIATDRRPLISATCISDEDCWTNNLAKATKSYTHAYLSGAAATSLTDQTEIIPLAASLPQYNLNTAGVYSLAELPTNKFMSVWVYSKPATSDSQSQKYRYVFQVGQWYSDSAIIEQARSPRDLYLADLSNIVPEIVYIGQIIITRLGSNWNIVDIFKLTGSKIIQLSNTGNFLSTVAVDGTTITGTGTTTDPAKTYNAGDGTKYLADDGTWKSVSGTIPISPSIVTRNEAGQITKNIVTVSEGVTIESRFNYADGIMTFFEIKNQVTGEWKRVTINYTEAVYTSKTVEIIEAWTI